MCSNCDSLENDISRLEFEIYSQATQIDELEDDLSEHKSLLEEAQQFEYTCQDLEDKIYRLNTQINDRETEINDYIQERDTALEQHADSQDEATSLEDQWNEHLAYLEENWPAVHADMLLRGDIK